MHIRVNKDMNDVINALVDAQLQRARIATNGRGILAQSFNNGLKELNAVFDKMIDESLSDNGGML